MIRVHLPSHLQGLAGTGREVTLEEIHPVTQRTVIDALTERYPQLLGCFRDRVTGRRRPLVRFFACGEDLSNEDPDAPLPESVRSGIEPFVILGAIAGG